MKRHYTVTVADGKMPINRDALHALFGLACESLAQRVDTQPRHCAVDVQVPPSPVVDGTTARLSAGQPQRASDAPQVSSSDQAQQPARPGRGRAGRASPTVGGAVVGNERESVASAPTVQPNSRNGAPSNRSTGRYGQA